MMFTTGGRIFAAGICLGVLLLAANLPAQQPAQASAPRTAEELVQAAYEATQTAETADDYTAILAICEEALKKNLNQQGRDYMRHLSAWAYNRRGKAISLQASGQEDGRRVAVLEARALADFEEAVRRDPKRWQAIHNRGVSYAVINEYDKAIADFSRTIELNPQFANAWFNRGEIYYQRRQYAKAIADYTRSIQLDDKDAGAYSARAHAYYQLQQYPRALADYNKAVELASGNVEYLTDRADVHANMGNWDEAAADYRQAVKVNSSYGRAYLGAAWLMATCPVERFRDAKLAIESAKTAIALDGEGDWHYLDTLAAAYANAGQYEQAQSAIANAIAKAPENQAPALKAREAMYAAGKPYRGAAP